MQTDQSTAQSLKPLPVDERLPFSALQGTGVLEQFPTLPMYATLLPKPFLSLSSDIVCRCALWEGKDEKAERQRTGICMRQGRGVAREHVKRKGLSAMQALYLLAEGTFQASS